MIQDESLQNSEYYMEFSRQLDSMTVKVLSDEGESALNQTLPQLGFIEAWKTKPFVQISNNESAASPEDSDQSQNTMGRFIKNKNRTSMTSRRDRRRTGILKKPFTVSELTKRFEGFKDAAEKGETENYRKSVIDELDKEWKNMQNDGFNEELYRSLSNEGHEDNRDYDEDVMGEKWWNEEFGSALSRSIENLRIVDNDDQEVKIEGKLF